MCLCVRPARVTRRVLFAGDHVRQDSMDFSKEWEDSADCRCTDRLKPLERRKARQHQRCLAHSLVGTPNYIAPEVLLRTGAVDRGLARVLSGFVENPADR